MNKCSQDNLSFYSVSEKSVRVIKGRAFTEKSVLRAYFRAFARRLRSDISCHQVPIKRFLLKQVHSYVQTTLLHSLVLSGQDTFYNHNEWFLGSNRKRYTREKGYLPADFSSEDLWRISSFNNRAKVPKAICSPRTTSCYRKGF